MQLCLLQKSSSFLLRLGQIRQNAEANNKNPTHRSLPYICALIKQAILTNPWARYIETILLTMLGWFCAQRKGSKDLLHASTRPVGSPGTQSSKTKRKKENNTMASHFRNTSQFFFSGCANGKLFRVLKRSINWIWIKLNTIKYIKVSLPLTLLRIKQQTSINTPSLVTKIIVR